MTAVGQAAGTGWQVRTPERGQAMHHDPGPSAGTQRAEPDSESHVTTGNPHGKVTSWVLIGVVIAAFIAGGAAIIIHAWWLLWICVGVTVAAVPAGKAIGIMDDTVAWGSTPVTRDPEAPPASSRITGREQS
jgi:hypothetical protein